MNSSAKKRLVIWGFAALAVVFGALVLIRMGRRLAAAGTLLRRIAEGDDAAVREEPFAVPDRDGSLAGRLYRPAARSGPLPAIVVCPGAAEGGIDDERFVRLARALAASGAAVFAPDLVDLRQLRITTSTVEHVVAAAAGLADRRDVAAGGRVGLAGISFAGSYALLAATDARVRDRLSCVIAFGGYEDLERVVRGWLTAPPKSMPGVYPVESYGKWIVLSNNVDVLVPEGDRAFLRVALGALIDGHDAPVAPPELSADGRKIYDAATTRGAMSPAAVDAVLAACAGGLRDLSLAGKLGELRCPVFLLHARGDPLIPESESEMIRREIDDRVPVRMLVTDLFEHVTIQAKPPGFFEALPMLRFVAGVRDACGL
ncbi:MAG: alpha/beta hydrolase [Planctomycetes bacterium]|nr:alpha/beta hydrolase [Planctomycetota bacterium]MBI3843822.1 alpha/beta hydrolase [Planctomycetota bacterium]